MQRIEIKQRHLRKRSLPVRLALGALLLVAATAHFASARAHVGRHGPQDKHKHAAPPALTKEQLARRFEKIQQRAKSRKLTRKQRARDRRKALQNRLNRILRGTPLTAPLKAELSKHARRVARLRRIRLVAAEAKDKDSVLRVDTVLAQENQRHERWWRDFREQRRRQKVAPGTAASGKGNSR